MVKSVDNVTVVPTFTFGYENGKGKSVHNIMTVGKLMHMGWAVMGWMLGYNGHGHDHSSGPRDLFVVKSGMSKFLAAPWAYLQVGL